PDPKSLQCGAVSSPRRKAQPVLGLAFWWDYLIAAPRGPTSMTSVSASTLAIKTSADVLRRVSFSTGRSTDAHRCDVTASDHPTLRIRRPYQSVQDLHQRHRGGHDRSQQCS